MSTLVVLLVCSGAAGVGLRSWRAQRSARRWSEQVEAAVPDVTDLIIVVLGAGGTLADAVRLVAERGPIHVRAAFAASLARFSAGTTLTRSLVAISDDLGPPFRALVAAMVATERDGAPIALLVLRLGDEARSARRAARERRARTLPVQLIFPLVFCSLPAVMIGAVLPLALVSFGRLGL